MPYAYILSVSKKLFPSFMSVDILHHLYSNGGRHFSILFFCEFSSYELAVVLESQGQVKQPHHLILCCPHEINLTFNTVLVTVCTINILVKCDLVGK